MEDEIGSFTTVQLQALFDILTHYEAYNEIQNLRDARTFTTFGTPLQEDASGTASSCPLINELLRRFILVLPGLRDVDALFWQNCVQGLAKALADCNLSESFDKGSIGQRKTFATGLAAILESVSRGVFGGYSAGERVVSRDYDTSNPADVDAAWNALLDQAIYGNIIDDIFEKVSQTDKLSEHTSLVQAAHEYATVLFAHPQQVYPSQY